MHTPDLFRGCVESSGKPPAPSMCVMVPRMQIRTRWMYYSMFAEAVLQEPSNQPGQKFLNAVYNFTRAAVKVARLKQALYPDKLICSVAEKILRTVTSGKKAPSCSGLPSKALITFVVAYTICCHATAAAAAKKHTFYTFCFWDAFSRWRPAPHNFNVSDIPAELCDAVIYSHVTIDNNTGQVKLTEKELQLDPEAKAYSKSFFYNPIWMLPPHRAFRDMSNLKKRNPKLKLLLAIGGPHETIDRYWQFIPQMHLWRDMVISIAQTAHDPEWMWSTAKLIDPFIWQIRQRFKEYLPDWRIILTLPAFDSSNHYLFDINRLSQQVNFFFVKSSDCLEFPRGAGLNVSTTMDMSDLQSGWQQGRSSEDSCPYLKDDEDYVAYEDEESVRKKASMIIGRKFRGAVVRSVDLDDYSSKCAGKSNLVKVLRSSFDAATPDMDYPYSPPTASWWDEDIFKLMPTTAPPPKRTTTRRPEVTTKSQEKEPASTKTPTKGQPETSSVTLPQRRRSRTTTRFCFWDGFSRFRSDPYKSSVSDIPAELCSAVVYSHVTIDENSHWIRLTDKELELDPQAKSYANSWIYNPIWLLPPNKVFEQMADLKKRNPNLKILLAVGGPHDPVEKYWQFIPVVYYWKDMTESLAQWLRTYDFDGVVLDFFSGTASLQDTVRNWDKAKFIHPFVRVCDQLQSGWEQGRSSQDSCPFLRKDEEYVAYEDDESILNKANMVMGRKYRGAAVRSVDLDDYSSQCAGKSNLLKGLRSSFDAANPDMDYPLQSTRRPFQPWLCDYVWSHTFSSSLALLQGRRSRNYYTFCFWDGFSRFRSDPYKSSVSDIPAELCSAVVYSHVTIDENSHWIRLTDKELELDPEARSYANSRIYNPIWLLPPNRVFEQMMDLKKRNPKLKILLAVGGPHDPVEKYWQFIPVVYYWKDMTESLAQWLTTYDFDGVVLDFFSGTASLQDTVRNWDKAKFIHPFVWQISYDLRAHNKMWSITLTLPAFDSTTHHLFDIERLTEEVNFFLVKSSDCLEFPKGALRNRKSDAVLSMSIEPKILMPGTMIFPFQIDRAELIVKKGAPRQRIVLEVPLTGRTYIATPAASGAHTIFPGCSGNYTNLQGSLASFEVCDQLQNGWEKQRSSQDSCPFLKKDEDYVAYEDEDSILKKANMVMGRQYRGAAVRSVDLDDYNSQCTGKSNLLRGLRSSFDAANPHMNYPYNPPTASWWDGSHDKMTPTTATTTHQTTTRSPDVSTQPREKESPRTKTSTTGQPQASSVTVPVSKDPQAVPNTPESLRASKEPLLVQSTTETLLPGETTTATVSGELLTLTPAETTSKSSTFATAEAVTAKSGDDICEGVKEGAMLPHESDCRQVLPLRAFQTAPP
ncbi:hypothetical protein MTO96_024635 [Rhipicephalus appendiculatus]